MEDFVLGVQVNEYMNDYGLLIAITALCGITSSCEALIHLDSIRIIASRAILYTCKIESLEHVYRNQRQWTRVGELGSSTS